MVEWLIRELFQLALQLAEWFIKNIIATFSFDLKYFTDNIPIIATSYSIFQAMGAGLVMLFFIWQCFKALGAPIGIESDNLIIVFFKSILAVFCVYRAQDIFNQGFIILRPIYDQIVSIANTSGGFEIDVSGAISTAIMTVMNLTMQGTTMIVFVGYAVLLLIVLFQLLKMLVELTERYILIGILALTSPLGFSTMTTKSTANIFAAWSRMVMGQFIIYLLNLWIIKAFISGFQTMPIITDIDGSGIIWLIFMWAFLKVSQKLDQFLGKLGIEVGNVGGSLMEEIMLAKSAIKIFTKGSSSGGGGTAAALKGNSGLGSAMKTAVGGGAVALGGIGLVRTAQKIGGTIKKSWEDSALNGLASYNKNIGTEAFKRAKTEAAEKGAGSIKSNIAGAAAWVSNGLGHAFGTHARTGKMLAKEINAKYPGDGLTKASDIEKLKKANVSANVLTNLRQSVESSTATKMLKTFVGEKERMGHLTQSMLNNKGLKTEAYNGGIKWTYDETSVENEKGEKGIVRYEGIIAVNSNNDAIKHIQNMRDKTPGVASDTIKKDGVELIYASKKSFIPDKPQYKKSRTLESRKTNIIGPNGHPIV